MTDGVLITVSNPGDIHELPPEEQDTGVDQALSGVLVALLKGVVYQAKQPDLWHHLLENHTAVIDYFTVIGLDVYLDRGEGYAFLRQKDYLPEDSAIPRLVQSRPLGFGLSVLCVLLRKWLLEHDAQGGELRCIINRRRVIDELQLYLKEEKNEAKRVDTCGRLIRRAGDLHLLQPLKNDPDQFEIQRITKALITADWLGELDERLAEYQQHVDG